MTEPVTIRVRSTGQDYTGRTPESIARRVWGRDVHVVYSSNPERPWSAEVVRTDKHGTHVLAGLYLDEQVSAAAETDDSVDPDDDLLMEVRASAAALMEAEARRTAAVRVAFHAGRDRSAIAAAAGKTRDWVYKTLR